MNILLEKIINPPTFPPGQITPEELAEYRREVELNLLPYHCQDCGKPADLADGAPDWAADGDRDVRYWATPCCAAYFVSSTGVEYLGGSPWQEVD